MRQRAEKNGYKNGTKFGSLASQIVFGGLLPTPKASEGERGTERKLSIEHGKLVNRSPKGVKYGIGIRQLAEQGFLPTPVSSDATVGSVIGKDDTFKETSTGMPRKINRNGASGSVGLARLVKLLPTPASSNYKGASSMEVLKARGRLKPVADNLVDQFAVPGKSSQLNPRFVMEMMGFPPNYCDSAFEKIAWEIYQKKKSTKSFQKRLQNGDKKQ
nr:hypothetical protein [Pseudarcicella hirudinis]